MRRLLAAGAVAAALIAGLGASILVSNMTSANPSSPESQHAASPLVPSRTASPLVPSRTPSPLVPSRTPSPPAPNSPPGWQLKFSATFPGSRLNTNVWGTCYPWTDQAAGCTNYGNPEYQWFLPSQDQVSGGILHLVAQAVPTQGQSSAGSSEVYSCRSGMVTTYPSFRFTYGYVQVIARMPDQPGLWSALWLAAANLDWPPEIDIVEQWGSQAGVYFHPVGSRFVGVSEYTSNLSVGWHTLALSWTPSQMVWYIDGRVEMTISQQVPSQPMYFIADLAESNQAAANDCAGTMLIRSVKIWQP